MKTDRLISKGKGHYFLYVNSLMLILITRTLHISYTNNRKRLSVPSGVSPCHGLSEH